jgi:hypothetical protein
MAPHIKQLKLPMLAIPLALALVAPTVVMAQSTPEAPGCVDVPPVKAPTNPSADPELGTTKLPGSGSRTDALPTNPATGPKTDAPEANQGSDPIKAGAGPRKPC